MHTACAEMFTLLSHAWTLAKQIKPIKALLYAPMQTFCSNLH